MITRMFQRQHSSLLIYLILSLLLVSKRNTISIINAFCINVRYNNINNNRQQTNVVWGKSDQHQQQQQELYITYSTSVSMNGDDNNSSNDVSSTSTTGRRRREERNVTTSHEIQRRNANTNQNQQQIMERRRQRQQSTETTTINRAPHQYDHTKTDARPFINNPLVEIEIQNQLSNSTSISTVPVYNSNTFTTKQGKELQLNYNHITYMSLDDIFPSLLQINNISLSKLFCTNNIFRTKLRNAIRYDIFNTTVAYQNMSEKARRMLLLPDSSIQGSWRCYSSNTNNSNTYITTTTNTTIRMIETTTVLQEYLGTNSITGDEFMETIGSLCYGDDDEGEGSSLYSSQTSNHWIDIVGISNRRISHSWHQDTVFSGTSANDNNTKKTVLLGFPKDDNYIGTGVFTHFIKLQYEQWKATTTDSNNNNQNQPIVYTESIDDQYIIRPIFQCGQEILVYRDVDVLHSAPDIAYRCSVMRFM